MSKKTNYTLTWFIIGIFVGLYGFALWVTPQVIDGRYNCAVSPTIEVKTVVEKYKCMDKPVIDYFPVDFDCTFHTSYTAAVSQNGTVSQIETHGYMCDRNQWSFSDRTIRNLTVEYIFAQNHTMSRIDFPNSMVNRDYFGFLTNWSEADKEGTWILTLNRTFMRKFAENADGDYALRMMLRIDSVKEQCEEMK
jgi:hypothetical protein